MSVSQTRAGLQQRVIFRGANLVCIVVVLVDDHHWVSTAQRIHNDLTMLLPKRCDAHHLANILVADVGHLVGGVRCWYLDRVGLAGVLAHVQEEGPREKKLGSGSWRLEVLRVVGEVGEERRS